MVGERARQAAGELVAVRYVGVLEGQGGGLGGQPAAGEPARYGRGAWSREAMRAAGRSDGPAEGWWC
jgi:hypothetical protein